MKGPEAFRTISEAADELGVPQHVLRFWEAKFSFIRPMKRAGGRRFYRPQDLDMLKSVRTLLREQGYTIKGVQRLHKEQGTKRLVQGVLEPEPSASAAEQTVIDAAVEDSSPVLMFSGGPALEGGSPKYARLLSVLNDLQAAKSRLNRLIKAP
jgi:DNA-binding transcriptional MerR regulator